MNNRLKFIIIILIISTLTLILYNNRFNIEFNYHILGYDQKLFDGDPLHPTYAYLKDNKLIGIESTANPECGQTNLKYFFDRSEKLNKIIYNIDFSDTYCNKRFDSLYVIKREENKIVVFEKNKAEINNTKLEEMITSFNLENYKTKIKTWEK